MTLSPSSQRADEAALSFFASVPRYLVHRRTVAEVLLTDWRRAGTSTFRCGAQWPRAHSFYAPRLRCHDPLLVAETLRQAGILVAHVGCEVPLGHRFLMERLAYGVDQNGLAVDNEPTDLLVEVALGDDRQGWRSKGGQRVDVRFFRAGRRVADGIGWMRCVPPAVYRRLRGLVVPRMRPAVLPPPIEPATVGRTAVNDVVIGEPETAGTFPLRVDTEHPVLFEHPLDHVPGMLVFEAMRQVGRALLGWPDAEPIRCDAAFTRFIELDQPCLVHASVRRPRSVGTAEMSVRLTQADLPTVDGVVTMRAQPCENSSPNQTDEATLRK